MKKVLLFFSVGMLSALLATSCCNCNKDSQCSCKEKKECAMTPDGERHRRPEHHMRDHQKPCCPMEGMNPEMKEKCHKWMKFDSLSVDEQKALLRARKAEIDSMEVAMAAAKVVMEQKWASFDKLSVEEQKELIEMKSHCLRRGGFEMDGPRRGHHEMGDKGRHQHGDKKHEGHHHHSRN